MHFTHYIQNMKKKGKERKTEMYNLNQNILFHYPDIVSILHRRKTKLILVRFAPA